MRIDHGRLARWQVALGFVLALTAWGLSSPAALPAAASTNCATSRQGTSDSEELRMLSMINAYRTQNGEGQLTPSVTLGDSALWKSADMAANHYFSHDDLSRAWSDRIHDCGYTSGFDGENLAAGYADAQETLQQWETSPPHNANLLNASYHAIGIGRAESSSGYWYWTADFGGQVDSSAPTPLQSSSTTPPPPPPVPSTPGAPSAAPAGLAAGQTVFVNTPNDCLRGRAAASLSANVLTCVPDGTPLLLVGGPVSADGYTWWQAYGAGWVAGQYLSRSP